MITLHRISRLTCQHLRSIISNRRFHIKPEPNEKITPLSQFDLSKPLIGRTSAEHTAISLLSPDMPHDAELLKVAIIGAPNAGKSTFVNRLMGWRISSVSKRPHTTRHRITGVLTDANKQIVFLDTPGFVAPWRKKRHNLEKSMILDPHSCLWDANLICVVHDVSNHWLRFKLDEEILKCLYAHPDKEAILILNKVDSIKRKRMLLDVTTVLTDGSLNGIPYRLDSPYHRNGEIDMERLFLKTAHEMNIPLPKTENDIKKELLLTDMKNYEKKLLDIQLENVNLDLEEHEIKELISQHEEKGLTLEKLSDNVSTHIPYKSMSDINPFEFKKDLMETTNWHLYYKKLSQIRLFTKDRSTWPYFNQVFMISAKQNHGIAAIRKYLFSRTKSAPWIFHRNFVTDQYPQEIAEMCIREKMLEYLPDEIPYSYLMTNDRWELDENDILNMTFIIYPRAKQLKRDVSVLLKNHGEAIKLISIETEKSLATTFRCEMTEHDIDLYYRTILEIIPIAGKLVCEGYVTTKQVKTKEGAADLLTEYDQRVEEILIEKLRENFPTHKFIGEESAAMGIKSPFSDDPTWIIDPIDGTTNFVHGFPYVAISVALAINKQVAIGIIFNPIMDHLYTAIRGKGAYKNGRIIKCSGQKELSLSQILGEFGPNREPAILNAKCKNLENIIRKVHSIRAMGSAALNLCLVAEGSCDAYFEYGVHIWDYAAGDLIAREAGAYTCDPSGATLNLIHRRILCAATKELAEQISPLLTHIDHPHD